MQYEVEAAAATHAELSASQASEAAKRVAAFLEANGLHFNGAGDATLTSVEQAWSVYHTDASLQAENLRTLDGIAAIMREYDHAALQVRD